MQNILTSVPSIAPIAEASVVGMESSFTDSIASELLFPSIWWWPPPLLKTRTSSNWCLEPSKIWIQILGGMLGLGLAIVGEDAVCPTEDEVTCKIDAAEDETNPTQSVVGDSAGLVACELWVKKGKNNYQIMLSDTQQKYHHSSIILLHQMPNLFFPEPPSKIDITCGVSWTWNSLSSKNPSAVSVVREIHSSACLQRIRKTRFPIAKQSLEVNIINACIL